MKKKNFKGRCTKRASKKSKEVCKTYNKIADKYLSVLENSEDIVEIHCNVCFDIPELQEYTTDFVCTKVDGDIMVRECVFSNHITKPMTVKLLDLSRNYWSKRGVTDWGLVIDENR